MVFWFAYSFDWNGTLGVLVAVLGVFFIGMAYLMSFVYGMMYLLCEMEHLIFWMNYLHHKDSKNCIYIWSDTCVNSVIEIPLSQQCKIFQYKFL